MSSGVWLASGLGLVGVTLSALAAYLGAQQGTRQREVQGRREEWGRRFTEALADLAAPDPRHRVLGRLLLSELAKSDLASVEEREMADRLLEEDARIDSGGADMTLLPPGTMLDDVTFEEDDGRSKGGHR